MQLVLLAAGKGSRLPIRFRNNPKCLVKINNKTILEHNESFYKKFKYRSIISGYKNYRLKKFIKKNNFQNIINKKYKTTNMVYSLFKLKNLKSNEIVVCYSDIIFDKNIFNNLVKKNKSFVLLKKNWLDVWKGRMKFKNIFKDAEDVKIKINKLLSIGQKIYSKLPNYQYMGIIKLTLNDFIKLRKFFRKLNKPKIDFTTFLNLSLKKKIINLKVMITNKYWYEIDNKLDIDFTSKKIW